METWNTKNAFSQDSSGSPVRLLKSTNQKIFFVHINKNAGSSMGLSIGIRVEGGPRKIFHMTAYQMKLLYGDKIFDDTYKFTVIRNPYDRFLSMYKFRKRTKQTGFNKTTPSLEDFFYEGFVGKSAKYRWGINGGQHGEEWMFMNQYDWICNPLNKEEIIIDRILSFENLQDDFDSMADFLKQPRIILPNSNSSNKKEKYLDFFKNPTFVSDFNQYYNRDFEFFKYDKI